MDDGSGLAYWVVEPSCRRIAMICSSRITPSRSSAALLEPEPLREPRVFGMERKSI
jgi:hypothetical protein